MEEKSNIKIVIDENSPRNQFVKDIIARATKKGIRIYEGKINKTVKNEQILYLSSQKGFIRPCPCSRKYRCCNYYTIDTIEGCIYDCEYCILKSFIDTSHILIKADIDELLLEIRNFNNMISSKRFMRRIGTGELSDSLAFEEIVPFAPILIEETRESEHLILEFKTKSNNIGTILNIPHNPKTTISFSMTTSFLHKELEAGTPNPNERLLAAKRCIDNSYKVGFHFDPITFYNGFKEDYQKLIADISKTIPADAINWISFGTIRFNPEMIDIFKSPLLFGEYISDAEKKMRYPFYLRKDIYKFFANSINEHFHNKVRIYLCMESDDLNKLIIGRDFKTDEDMNRYIIGEAFLTR